MSESSSYAINTAQSASIVSVGTILRNFVATTRCRSHHNERVAACNSPQPPTRNTIEFIVSTISIGNIHLSFDDVRSDMEEFTKKETTS
jgi:hypothetical protein